MIKVPTENGEITISDAVFTTITGAAATNCFGVKGMAQRSMTDGLVHLQVTLTAYALKVTCRLQPICSHIWRVLRA